jgi:FMN reductase
MQTDGTSFPRRPRSLVVVSAGLSQPSSTRLLADRLAVATERRLQQRGVAAERTTVELRDHGQELMNNLLTGFPAERLRAAIDAVVAADGLVAVTPIFNASYSGLFKLFFDVIERDGLASLPVVIGATGGTARHSLALEHAVRPMFAYLDAAVMPTAVYAAAEDWGSGDMPADASLSERIDRAAGELAHAMVVLERPAPSDPFEDVVPFEQLLGGESTPRSEREGAHE